LKLSIDLSSQYFDITKAIYVVLGTAIEKNLEVDEYFSNNAH
jgi:hypothetical protein